jgi:hypothetical protein
MAPVVDLEKPRLIYAESKEVTLAESSGAVVTITEAGSEEVRVFVVGSLPVEAPFLRGEDYPALVRVWDNDDDAIFDTM